MSERSTRRTWSPWTPPDIANTSSADDPSLNPAESRDDDAPRAAETEGYAKGMECGRAEGYRRGFIEGQAAGREHWDAQCESQARDMEALLRGVGKALSELDSVAPDSMLDTTLAAARYLAMTALDAHPDRVREVILKVLAADPVWGDKTFLVINPADAALLDDAVADQVAAAGVSIRPDPSVARSDCVITGTRGAVKANRETRWKAMLAHLRDLGDSHD